MFAILGLVGLALSTVMITGPDWSEQDTATDSDDSATDLSEPDAEIVSVDAILGETASGISEQTPNDAQIFSGSADDLMETGSGNDLVDAEGGNDTIFAGAGDDEIHGGRGDDVLLAGVGDNLNGGTGADQYGLTIGGNAFIDDFDPDEDRISVSYDAQGDAPIVRYEDTDEGALLIANGQIVATFAGHAVLDLAGVPIVFTALDPAA
jgi:Ca2+-binding RTX toxin-like protein